MDLSPRLRSALTLAVLALLVVVGTAWGFAQVTEPFPGRAEPSVCVDEQFAAGERIYPQNVTVSVVNASTRVGLAGRTMSALVDEGFARGEIANAAEGVEVKRAEIWTTDADNPAVLLVRSRFGQVEVVEMPDPGAAGIVLVVGNALGDELFDGRPSILVESDTAVCGPPV
jgi:hypothetical protein